MASDFEAMTRAELIRELELRDSYLQEAGLQLLVQELESYREELACHHKQLRGAESIIEEERNRYSELYDFAPLPLLTFDASGFVIEANLTACDFLGVSQTRLVGMPFSMALVPDSVADFRKHLLKCRYSEAALVCTEVQLRDPGQSSRIVELHTQAVGREDQVRFRTAVHHLRERRQTSVQAERRTEELQEQLQQRTAELQEANAVLQQQVERSKALAAQLQASEARLRGLVKSETDGIFQWHADGRITDANQAFLDLIGYDRAELESPGLGWTTITPPEYADADQRVLAQLRSFGHFKPYEKEFVRKDGSRAQVLFGAGLVPGSPDEGIAFVVDMSDRKAAEQRLQLSERRERERNRQLKALSDSLNETNRRKDQFLAMLGHELRNPLGPLANACDLLRKYTPQMPEVDETWDVVQRQVTQLSRLVDDLLDVSRISAGRILLRRSTVDLADIVRRTGADFSSVAADSGLTLKVSLPATPVWIDGDPMRLAQVVGNLINNACKFTDAGGEVELSLTTEGDQALLQVRDTGIGIRREVLERLFDAFVQDDKSMGRSRGGLGLGLALVRGLVDLHGGRVWAESDGLGTGSRFLISLPIVSAEVVTVGDPRLAIADRLRVLIVEDNRDAAYMLRKLLQSMGHEVAVAGDGKEALGLALVFKPDLVLADIGLPQMDGYAMAQALRALPEFEHTYFVAVTGYGQASDEQQSLAAGYDQHVTKPATTETLQWVLRLAAARRASGNGAAV